MDRLVFLDFDGVLCDSLNECLVSSWEAYFGLLRGKAPDRVPLALHAEFRELRPFVRSGEDYVLLQELIESGVSVRSQQDFDRQLGLRGPQTMREYKDLMYRARSELLRRDKPYWIGLNRIYPFLLPDLVSWVRSPCLYILSTKKASYILEILAAREVLIDPARVLHCGALDKPSVIAEVARRHGSRRALWIDDQVDQLRSGRQLLQEIEVHRCLASWGYLKNEWLEQDLGMELLTPPRLAGKLLAWSCPRAGAAVQPPGP